MYFGVKNLAFSLLIIMVCRFFVINFFKEVKMNIQGLMQQAQKMQKRMAALEAEFKTETFNTEAGGGAVKVTMTGDMKITNIEFSKDLLSGEDSEMLTDLFIAAVNQSIETVRKEKENRLSKLVGNKINGFPGLF